MFLEHGYGQRHGYADAELEAQVGGLRSREQLLADSDIVVLPKPVGGDLAAMRPGQVLWGWPHCVQDPELTQIGIDRRLTVIAWEAMNHWTPDGAFSLHVAVAALLLGFLVAGCSGGQVDVASDGPPGPRRRRRWY